MFEIVRRQWEALPLRAGTIVDISVQMKLTTRFGFESYLEIVYNYWRVSIIF